MSLNEVRKIEREKMRWREDGREGGRERVELREENCMHGRVI